MIESWIAIPTNLTLLLMCRYHTIGLTPTHGRVTFQISDLSQHTLQETTRSRHGRVVDRVVYISWQVISTLRSRIQETTRSRPDRVFDRVVLIEDQKLKQILEFLEWINTV